MSKMIEILRSTDSASKQRHLSRLKKDLEQLTEEKQLIELSLGNEQQ